MCVLNKIFEDLCAQSNRSLLLGGWFENVTFSYSAEKPLITDLSLVAELLNGQVEVHREWVHRTARGERLLVARGVWDRIVQRFEAADS